MAGLVLEGGAFRGLFSCGVLDALLDEQVEFPYVIGVSSGASYGISYVSRQRGRNWEVTQSYTHSADYLHPRNFLRHRSIMNTSLVFDDIPTQHIPFDFSTFFSLSHAVCHRLCRRVFPQGVLLPQRGLRPLGPAVPGLLLAALLFPPRLFQGPQAGRRRAGRPPSPCPTRSSTATRQTLSF